MVLERSFAPGYGGPTAGVINYTSSEDKFVPREPLFSYTYSPAPDGRPQTNARYEPTEVIINDIRDDPSLTLEAAGFQHITSESTLSEAEFQSLDTNLEEAPADLAENQVLARYHAEVEGILRRAIPNAKRVITYNQRVRLHTPKTGLNGYDFTSPKNFPLLRPHIDLSPESAAELVESLAGIGHRAFIVNVWRPIRGTVLDAPLAVTDARSLSQEAKIHTRFVYPEREKGSYSIQNKGDIKWYFISAQEPSDVLLFKQYDSENPGHVVGHTAFLDERFDGQPGVVPRWSIETRSVVILE
ncbi:hypothetical protein L202_07058 [Cryptococcus amylolentus CBS 6039]|uniref:Methyltransferase n=1 Tax=Cryptococcus amylolentus CBS 6039 TaxID=1295533 RepID=A0A1E3HH34_9TREE|nr:hypothetical protein L202_07058 [Cryptococcus amylolentus CBS 6039]ODN74731.1 hypothetical protein L202_07058 [Cryptococcus amylolentus CBS 6039]